MLCRGCATKDSVPSTSLLLQSNNPVGLHDAFDSVNGDSVDIHFKYFMQLVSQARINENENSSSPLKRSKTLVDKDGLIEQCRNKSDLTLLIEIMCDQYTDEALEIITGWLEQKCQARYDIEEALEREIARLKLAINSCHICGKNVTIQNTYCFAFAKEEISEYNFQESILGLLLALVLGSSPFSLKHQRIQTPWCRFNICEACSPVTKSLLENQLLYGHPLHALYSPFGFKEITFANSYVFKNNVYKENVWRP
jgi:hypothetical protein